VQFYAYSFDSLLKYEALAEARLNGIDERLVQRFTVWALARNCERDEERTCSVATVNRWRATLRKALRMAPRWKLIQAVPEISRLKGERERSFVFTALRKKYQELAPEPLNSFIQFSCEIGICEGEIIDLVKADVHMTDKADEWGHYGYLQIRKGKTDFRKRGLPITARAKDILTAWMAKSKSDLVFTREDRISPISAFTLIQRQERMRNLLNLPWDACVHFITDIAVFLRHLCSSTRSIRSTSQNPLSMGTISLVTVPPSTSEKRGVVCILRVRPIPQSLPICRPQAE
jgi:hypothetical protein